MASYIVQGRLPLKEEEKVSNHRQEVDGIFRNHQLDNDQDGIPDGGLISWLQVVSGFCIWFNTWGLVSSYGVYQTYYESIFLKSQYGISWIGSAQGALLLFGSLFAGYLYDLGYLRYMMFGGNLLMIGGMLISSVCTRYWEILLTQGIVTGVGASLLFVPALSTLQQYFKRRQGLATGIASTGNAVGGFCFPILFRHCLDRVGISWTTRILAFAMSAFSLPPVLIMKQRSATKNAGCNLIRHWQAIANDKQFLHLCMSIALINASIYVPLFYLPTFALEHSTPPVPIGRAFYLVAFANGASAIGRIVPGALGDKIGLLNMQLVAGVCTLILVSSWMAVYSPTGLIAWSIGYGGVTGAFLSLAWPLMASLTTDKDTVGVRLGVFGVSAGVGMLGGSPIAGAIKSRSQWAGLQIWCIICVVLAILMLSCVRILHFGCMRKGKI